ncbi:hypothetical protein BRADI_2g40558v3 [Brachypodium distachyon]|uniref:protein-serine/threonine phosphatase n=1 Tax=Brachypodium distachyon TaxID=15368 RepID=A0A0Q3R3Z1_BRADI|nr:hypothetical protein BRADI_2g40558v3 [Brachypodium distachyon]
MPISKKKSSTSNLCLQSFAFLNLVTSSHAKFRTINLLQPMQSHYQLVIFASDGLWEHLTDPEVVEIVGSTSHSHMEHGACVTCLDCTPMK